MRKTGDFQSHCSGIGGGPSLAQLEPYNTDVHGLPQQEYSTPARIPTPWNAMKLQRR